MPERDTTPTEPGLKMLPGMMPILHSPAVITPGQFGPIRRDFDPASARLTLIMSATGMPSVMQTMSGISGAIASTDRIGGARRRHVDDGGVGARRGLAFGDRVEHRQAEMGLPALPRRRPADHDGPVGHRLFGMEGAVLAGEALAQDLGVAIDQDGHLREAALRCFARR